MENTEYYNLGFKLGEKCKDSRFQLQHLIRMATSNSKDYELIKNKLISICFANNEPIPDFTATLGAENDSPMIAYLMGLNNGSLHK